MPPKNPKPFNIVFVALIVFDWHCPRCSQLNSSQRASSTEYLAAKCGHCHFWTILDYHRVSDAPPAALALARVHLGETQAPPGIRRKFAQKQHRQDAGDNLK